MLYVLFGSENLVKLTFSGANYKDFEVVISFVNFQELEIQKTFRFEKYHGQFAIIKVSCVGKL